MEEKNFVTFEYKTVSVRAEEQARIADLYEAFGWEITATSPTLVGGVTLTLKRDRKQRHRQELVKAERQAESVYATIRGLERSKRTGADCFSYTFGIAATLVFGGGMCLALLLTGVPALVGGIVLGLAGLALCAANYFIYKKLVERRLKKVLPAIDDNEEKLANLLERGNGLLAAETI